jgi:putative transposase
MAASFNGLYKTELIYHEGPWKNADEVEWATLTYIDWFNNRRIHNESGRSRQRSSRRTTAVRSTQSTW